MTEWQAAYSSQLARIGYTFGYSDLTKGAAREFRKEKQMYIIGGIMKTMAGPDIQDGVIHVADGKIAEIGARDEIKIHPADCEQVLEIKKGYAILVREEFSCLINSHEQGHEQLDSGKLNTGGHK